MLAINNYSSPANKKTGFSAIEVYGKESIAKRHGIEFAEKLLAAADQLPNYISKNRTLRVRVCPYSDNEVVVSVYKYYGERKKELSGKSGYSGPKYLSASSNLDTIINIIEDAASLAREKAKAAFKRTFGKQKTAETVKTDAEKEIKRAKLILDMIDNKYRYS